MASLVDSNPYIKEKADRDFLITRSVISSSACEGIILEPKDLELTEERIRELRGQQTATR